MKKVFLMVFALMFVLFIPMALYAQSGWVLYDDFESGYIDDALWNIDNSSAAITVENGKAKFSHRTGTSDDSSWLYFKNPGKIEAVKATVIVESTNGNSLARIAGYTAQSPEGYVVWQEIRVISDYIISYWSGENDVANDWMNTSQCLYVEFLSLYSGDLLGQEHTLMMTMQPIEELTIGGPELGFMTQMKKQSDLTESSDPFLGIGTRSRDNEGEMVVYFDNVYVKYRNNISDKYNRYDRYDKYDKYD